jgi:hypothetical protein
MFGHPLPPPLSVEEYLELEENSTVKHEYLDGYVYAMAGGTVDHGAIAVNVLAALRPLLRGGSCRVYNSDVKVRLGPRRFVYPDLSVSCDPRDYADGRAPFIRGGAHRHRLPLSRRRLLRGHRDPAEGIIAMPPHLTSSQWQADLDHLVRSFLPWMSGKFRSSWRVSSHLSAMVTPASQSLKHRAFAITRSGSTGMPTASLCRAFRLSTLPPRAHAFWLSPLRRLSTPTMRCAH